MTDDGKRRRALRARAHALRPVVTVGQAGPSAAVLAELDRALETHELLKVRMSVGDRESRRADALGLASRVGAEVVQCIGRVVVMYRERTGEPAPGAGPDHS